MSTPKDSLPEQFPNLEATTPNVPQPQDKTDLTSPKTLHIELEPDDSNTTLHVSSPDQAITVESFFDNAKNTLTPSQLSEISIPDNVLSSQNSLELLSESNPELSLDSVTPMSQLEKSNSSNSNSSNDSNEILKEPTDKDEQNFQLDSSKKPSLSSLVFIISSMKRLLSTKEVNKSNKPILTKGLDILENKLKDSTEVQDKYITWEQATALLEGLELISEPPNTSSATIILVLDIIEKLVSFEILKKLPETIQNTQEQESSQTEKKNTKKKPWRSILTDFSDRLIKITCKGFTGSSTSYDLQLQIVKTVLTMILSPELKIHQDSLLRAVRSVVNIHLLSYNSPNEAISEAALLQIINTICKRAQAQFYNQSPHSESSTNDEVLDESNPKTIPSKNEPITSHTVNNDDDLLNDIEARDVFLVFWALSKLSMRKNDDVYSDLKKFSERSRFISLLLMRVMLKDYHDIFTNLFLFIKSSSDDYNSSLRLSASLSRNISSNQSTPLSKSETPTKKDCDYSLDTSKDVDGATLELHAAVETALKHTPELTSNLNTDTANNNTEKQNYYTVPLIIVIKQYLSLSLSRNLVSTNLAVLGISLEIFELIFIHLRNYLKQEIEVLMKEIIFPIMSMKHAGSLPQRIILMRTLCRILLNPALVVELYLNYDCDPNSQVQIFQQLTEQLCKTSCAKVDFSKNTGGSGMWEAWVNMPTAYQEAIEDNLWKMVQQIKSVFRSGSTKFNLGSDLSTNSSLEPFINSSLSFDFLANSSCITIDQGILSMSLSSNDNIKKYGYSQRASNSNLNSSAENKPKNAIYAESDEYILRQLALNALCYMLQSMYIWSNQDITKELAIDQIESSQAKVSIEENNISDEYEENKVNLVTKSFSKVSMSRSSSHNTRQMGINVIQSQDDANLQQLQANKLRKERFAKAIAAFNWKPKKGMAELINEGFIPSENPEDVANSLVRFSQEGLLNKAVLGEYLGEGDSYNIEVMHKYVDVLHFQKMSFTDALRLFLQGFRLPGEAQKIDRFMLKFAERYVGDNQGEDIFSNADAAYVLAYSTIMLNTDQHNNQVKNRMTKEEFIQNNRGINNGGNIKKEFLETIFDEINANEIKLKDDPLDKNSAESKFTTHSDDGSLFFLELWRRRQSDGKLIHLMNEHSAKMANQSEQKIKAITKTQEKQNGSKKFWFLEESKYTKATRIEHVSSMFATIWPPVLAALSLPLQSTSDPRAIFSCLIALQSCIALSCRFKLTLERAAFITTLSKFTILGNLNDISYKQAEATRAFLEISLSGPDIGDGLEEDWIYTLQCISLLDRLRLLMGSVPNAVANSSTFHTKDYTLSESEKYYEDQKYDKNKSLDLNLSKTPKNNNKKPPSKNTHISSYMYDISKLSVTKAKLSKLEPYFQMLDIVVDKIFSSSILLSGKGIVDFVKALTFVTLEEIDYSFATSSSNPVIALVGEDIRKESINNDPSNRPNSYDANSYIQDFKNIEDYHNSLQEHKNISNDNISLDFNSKSSSDKPRASLNINKSTSSIFANYKSRTLNNFAFNDHAFLRVNNSSSISDNSPRLYMLTRIVEIVYYNMDRIKFEWSKIWVILGDLFDRAGSYPDTRVAEYTLDSLRQLSSKFLELNELSHFQFQKQFLRPFVTVLDHQSNLCAVSNGHTVNVGDRFVKDMVLKCIKQLVKTKSKQLRSGWRSVLTISRIAATDFDDKIAELGFELSTLSSDAIIQLILSNNITVDSNESELFSELIICLSTFSFNSNRPKLALNAVDLMSQIADSITLLDIKTNKINENISKHFKVLLKSLHQVVLNSDDLEIRSLALEKCYFVAKSKAKEFDANLWDFFFKEIGFVLFSDIQGGYILSSKYTKSDDIELWVSTTLVKAIRLMIALFVYSFENSIDISNHLDSLFDLLRTCICQQNETLSRIGAASLQDFVEKCYFYFSCHSKNRIVNLFTELLGFSQPELLFEIGSKNQTSNFKSSDDLYYKITLKCVLQLQLINSIADLFVSSAFSQQVEHTINNQAALLNSKNKVLNSDLFGIDLKENFITSPVLTYFSNKDFLSLLDSLNQSRLFAHRFNSNLAVRRRLVERGVTPQLPSLLKQETSSSLVIILLLEKIYFYYIKPDILIFDASKKISNDHFNRDDVLISEYLEPLESRLSNLFLTIFVSYNFSSSALLGPKANVKSFIPWPRSFAESELLDLKLFSKEKSNIGEQILTFEKHEINDKLQNANTNKIPINTQIDTTTINKTQNSDAINPNLEDVGGIDNDTMQSVQHSLDESTYNLSTTIETKISEAELSLDTSNAHLETQSIDSKIKKNSPELSDSNTSNLSNLGDVISISDNHRYAWRRCIFAAVSFLAKVYLHDKTRFKILIKPIFNEILKALSTAFNSGDNLILAHIQFFLACVSSAYEISDNSLCFV
ncbi:hypothetical protein BB561_002643 [Smittium simulii]|uniref:SEC7 domain-containing protein n=1 Tax=Smittium simulii TaxID=133385 RepID=A0A2T9YPR7_9FUNG|nr:hypothetical protein BB561_002643 [Smittium simulii]